MPGCDPNRNHSKQLRLGSANDYELVKGGINESLMIYEWWGPACLF